MLNFSIQTLTIDKQTIAISPNDNNLVETAKRIDVAIPAPCLKNGRRDGCCKACLVQIDDEQSYACSTKPKAGMNITVRTPDLDKMRKEAIKLHKRRLKSGAIQRCDSKC